MKKLPTSRLTDRQRELLRLMRVAGQRATYSSPDHIPDWAALKKVMITLGAKPARGSDFLFPDDADAEGLIEHAVETGEVVDPRKAGFFETPDALADRVIELAVIRPGDRVDTVEEKFDYGQVHFASLVRGVTEAAIAAGAES